jgi:hypothetical protein
VILLNGDFLTLNILFSTGTLNVEVKAKGQWLARCFACHGISISWRVALQAPLSVLLVVSSICKAQSL